MSEELRQREWQPIETAPRDGSAVLVMRDIWPGTASGRAEECNGHNTYVAEWWQGENGGAGAWICYMDAVHDPACPVEPTHWMSLPKPPRASRATPPSPSTASEVGELRCAAEDVVKRWDSPLWKSESTAELIHRLRAALAAKTADNDGGLDIAAIADELEDATVGYGGPMVERIEQCVNRLRGLPNCGACAGDGLTCPTICRVAAQSPAAIAKSDKPATQPSTGEVDVEAELRKAIEFATEPERAAFRKGLLAARRSQAEWAKDKYNELLFAVARKFPGESRHETALRYIRAAEAPQLSTATQSTEQRKGEGDA